ncbi:branched-chain amino acid transport system II carrier protein [Muricauda ruestringensis]|uniref:Branched-chain amino acid transport system II carrier protein n=1 Tax=Flagellimonas aurea TaxID=2915619 RepID=A0ABS3G0K6_9FLAO|nr:branched-chain amino acid transport system II carrier protein [Allomuricauda aurea]MAO16273.1 branched-chain amino acid transport system II carrier protein [Allomuricauda sp.]MBO0352912.1 branched-chain amino acid transport system II carrier protein [Allomuricauda aurea]
MKTNYQQSINKKSLTVTAFALFSLFFGAGNLVLPPLLGFKSGHLWWLVALGFCISGALVPILGIVAHAKLQGTLFDFAKKVSPSFSVAYCYLIYAIAIALPSPRTASVTHEMAIQPFWGSSSLLTSLIYFMLVFVFAINRTKVLDALGKILTPGILIILLIIIMTAIFTLDFDFVPSDMIQPFSSGILEGYQTFDAIGAVVVGAVIIISVNIKEKSASYEEKRRLIRRAGLWAGAGLFLVYGGLILTGALFGNSFDNEITRTALLRGISTKTLGETANLLLSILVSLACFTTAVGIVTGTSDFIKGRFNDSLWAYRITAFIGCVLGVLIGQFDVGYIITVAVPALMFIYPITIILILLNVSPGKYASEKVFRWVVGTTILFSVPDFLGSIGLDEHISHYVDWIPLSQHQMGWVLPALVVFIVGNLGEKS